MMEGTLEAFGAVEMLQMLGRMKLSGTLHIECPQRRIDIRFVRGGIAETRDSERSSVGTVLGRLLVERALVTEEELARVLAQQEADPRPLGTFLVERGLVHEHDMREVLSRQIANTVLAARFETHGVFRFATDEHPPETDVIAIDTHAVLLEISALGGECRLAVEVLAHGDTVLVRGEQRSLPGGWVPSDDAAQVLAQVDGLRTVRDLVAGSAMEAMTVISILGRLIECGALLVRAGRQADVEAPAQPAHEGVTGHVGGSPGLVGEEQAAAAETL